MIQYLIVLLDDTSVSFCHYNNTKRDKHIMPIDTLRAGILYAMKQNLSIQFVYPEYELPDDHQTLIESVEHTSIKSASLHTKADVVVFNNLSQTYNFSFTRKDLCVLRIDKACLFEHVEDICSLLNKVERLNIVITDIETFVDEDFKRYSNTLRKLSKEVEKIYIKGDSVQFNLLTDRMMLNKMNNCGAGETCVTLAPDGAFYACPAFYAESKEDCIGKLNLPIGNLQVELSIKNAQLYKLDHAPLCRHCDAYQCRRCIWLNRKTTYEVNTPSHEQCVVAHLERNASRDLMQSIRKQGTFLPDFEGIKKITYLDPFDVRKEWD